MSVRVHNFSGNKQSLTSHDGDKVTLQPGFIGEVDDKFAPMGLLLPGGIKRLTTEEETIIVSSEGTPAVTQSPERPTTTPPESTVTANSADMRTEDNIHAEGEAQVASDKGSTPEMKGSAKRK